MVIYSRNAVLDSRNAVLISRNVGLYSRSVSLVLIAEQGSWRPLISLVALGSARRGGGLLSRRTRRTGHSRRTGVTLQTGRAQAAQTVTYHCS